jgi:sulfite reductase alpha subunit-like flavoprotein
LSCFKGQIKNIRELRQKSNAYESTLHIDVELPRGKKYATACNLIVFGENTPENVSKALKCLNLPSNQTLSIEPSGSEVKRVCPPVISAGALVSQFMDLQGPLRKSQLKTLSKYTKNPSVAKEY